MIRCPVCQATASEVESVRASAITSAITAALPDLLPSYLPPIDYLVARCSICTLDFAEPMRPGDDNFYGWICASRHYYPHARWEWVPLIHLLRREMRAHVLDVGCGSGLFLEELRAQGLRGSGVDANADSVTICRARGLDAECIGLEALDESLSSRYDAITLFHVIEHLSDPVGALLKLRSLLQPGGIIAVSVPHSPMSFETDFHDPLNRPPHHLTRWNQRSLAALALAAGLDHRIVVQPSRGVLSRTLSTLQLQFKLPPVSGGRLARSATLLARAGVHPWATARILRHQLRRDRDMGGPKGDAVLMILNEPSS